MKMCCTKTVNFCQWVEFPFLLKKKKRSKLFTPQRLPPTYCNNISDAHRYCVCVGDWDICRVRYPAPGRLATAPHCRPLCALLQVQVIQQDFCHLKCCGQGGRNWTLYPSFSPVFSKFKCYLCFFSAYNIYAPFWSFWSSLLVWGADGAPPELTVYQRRPAVIPRSPAWWRLPRKC